MPDRKYGRVFTSQDVDDILDFVKNGVDQTLGEILAEMDEEGYRFKFEPDEPVFVLRGHDKRAEGAIKHYEDHQGASAPANHLDGIAAARREFQQYREANPGKMREPD